MLEELTEQLRRDEGEVRHAYQDHLGYWTIGIGRLIDKRRGGGLTKEECTYLLENDINKRHKELQQRISWFNNLDDPRQGVLLNMAFQMGVEGLLGFKTTLKCIEAGKYEDAAENMSKSLWASQTPIRANRLIKQMITGKWQ
jgi:lysozyme